MATLNQLGWATRVSAEPVLGVGLPFIDRPALAGVRETRDRGGRTLLSPVVLLRDALEAMHFVGWVKKGALLLRSRDNSAGM